MGDRIGIEPRQSLLNILSQNITANSARLKTFTCLILAVIEERTVNLTILASHNPNQIQQESNYRKLQRWFESFCLPWQDVARLTLSRIKRIPKSMDNTRINTT